MKFNHNDRVMCTIQGYDITDARISIDADGTPFICHNNEECACGWADNKLGYKYSWALTKRSSVTNLKLAAPKTLDDIAVGDVIVNTGGEERTVAMRTDDIIIFTFKDDGIQKASGPYHIDELKHDGYTLKTPELVEPVAELTVEEISKRLGYEVKVVK